MSYDNTNRFAVWPNKNRRQGKNDPHWTGTINIDGREYWMNAWKKKDDAPENAPSVSGSVKPKDGQPQAAPDPQLAHPGFDDDIPFMRLEGPLT